MCRSKKYSEGCRKKGLWMIPLILLLSLRSFAAEGKFPAWYETTTHLNVRASDNARARRLGTLPPDTQIQVDYMTSNDWAAIQYEGRRGYVSSRYIRYVNDVEATTTKPSNNSASHKIGVW